MILHRQLNVRTFASQDSNTPGPDEQVEADVEECRQEQTLGTEQRLQDGETDETAVDEHQGELCDLALVQITEALAKQKGKSAHDGVKYHAHADVQKAVLQVVVGEFCLRERRNDHHGLANLDDECGESLGSHVINDSFFAGKEAAGHEQKQSGNNGE